MLPRSPIRPAAVAEPNAPPLAEWPDGWLVLTSGPQSGADNMAMDLALLRRASETGRAVLRLYEWQHPTVSFGRNEPVAGMWDTEALHSAGYDVVRRPTGGRALLHEREVTWSVTLPLPRGVPWRQMYDAVNTRLVTALARLGVPAALLPDSDAKPQSPDGPLCFALPSAGEVMVFGRKLAGSAVWRADGGYLQHGSILLTDRQHTLSSFRRDRLAEPSRTSPASPRAVHERSAGLDDFLPDTPPAEMAQRVRDALRKVWQHDARDIQPLEPSAEDIVALDLAHAELASQRWLWRR